MFSVFCPAGTLLIWATSIRRAPSFCSSECRASLQKGLINLSGDELTGSACGVYSLCGFLSGWTLRSKSHCYNVPEEKAAPGLVMRDQNPPPSFDLIAYTSVLTLFPFLFLTLVTKNLCHGNEVDTRCFTELCLLPLINMEKLLSPSIPFSTSLLWCQNGRDPLFTCI